VSHHMFMLKPFLPSLYPASCRFFSYYVSEHVLKGASAIGRKELALLGTCFGKFSGSGKFRLHITCLDYLAQVCPAARP
jgi:ribosome biogenesis protein Nip4